MDTPETHKRARMNTGLNSANILPEGARRIRHVAARATKSISTACEGMQVSKEPPTVAKANMEQAILKAEQSIAAYTYINYVYMLMQLQIQDADWHSHITEFMEDQHIMKAHQKIICLISPIAPYFAESSHSAIPPMYPQNLHRSILTAVKVFWVAIGKHHAFIKRNAQAIHANLASLFDLTMNINVNDANDNSMQTVADPMHGGKKKGQKVGASHKMSTTQGKNRNAKSPPGKKQMPPKTAKQNKLKPSKSSVTAPKAKSRM